MQWRSRKCASARGPTAKPFERMKCETIFVHIESVRNSCAAFVVLSTSLRHTRLTNGRMQSQSARVGTVH
jgi:hypothetical protein